MKYRAEIDGLRALAVVPVILFHAGFELFSGGFVGVDVFFVISGYLITTILIEDIENKRLSIINFYERRARRILPALFFVMLVCIPFAWLWMLPSQMKDFSQSFVAISLFASNILFWRERGYFSAASEEIPFLHTWSLAVEEQYYVMFPIFLILVWRFGRNKVFWLIVVMLIMSLILSEFGWRIRPTANFYLAPTRAWELFAGSLAAFIVQNNGVQKNNSLAFLGLAAIFFSIFVYDESTPFPSVYAIIPVSGVILLVLYAEKETLVASLLSNKVIVKIGLISYSAYLWHQPLFAFARIKVVNEPSHLIMSILAFSSFPLAYLSWKFIETPFRDKLIINRTKIFCFSIIGLLLFSSFGIFGYFADGKITKISLPPNISYESLGSRISNEGLPCSWSSQFSSSNEFDGCIFGDFNSKDNIVLIGDSHSQALSYEFENWAMSNQKKIFWLKMNGCEYFPDIVRNRQPPEMDCKKNHAELLAFISSLNAEVIMMFRWTFRMYPIDELELSMPYRNSFGDVENENYREYFLYDRGNFVSSYKGKQQYLIDYVSSVANSSKRLFLIHPVPETAIDILRKNYFNLRDTNRILNEISIPLAEYNERNSFIFETFKKLPSDNITHIYTGDLFCDNFKCYMQRNGIPLYLDDDHLSDNGARLILNKLNDYF